VIFVDTSVWVEALRRRESREALRLDALLEADEVALAAPVRFEILAGASVDERRRLRRVLSALPTFFPSGQTWTLLDTWLDVAGAQGERFGFADALIGALAAQQAAPIWSLDGDVRRMARLKFVEIYQA
jgi:predicted nucleic acid-binding protein